MSADTVCEPLFQGKCLFGDSLRFLSIGSRVLHRRKRNQDYSNRQVGLLWELLGLDLVLSSSCLPCFGRSRMLGGTCSSPSPRYYNYRNICPCEFVLHQEANCMISLLPNYFEMCSLDCSRSMFHTSAGICYELLFPDNGCYDDLRYFESTDTHALVHRNHSLGCSNRLEYS